MENLIEDKQEGEIKYWSDEETVLKGFYSISVFCNPEDRIPYHMHKRTVTIVKKIEGEGKIIFDGKEMPLPETMYIPPETPHKIIGDSLVVLNMETPPDENDFIILEK